MFHRLSKRGWNSQKNLLLPGSSHQVLTGKMHFLAGCLAKNIEFCTMVDGFEGYFTALGSHTVFTGQKSLD